jgi:hypothetical protein
MNHFIEIDGKKYPLKYGYGAIALMGKYWNLDGYEAVINKLANIFPEGQEIQMKFDVLEVIGDLIQAGIANADGDNVKHEDIVDAVMADPSILVNVFENFRSKLPQGKPVETKKKVIPKRQPQTNKNP